MARRAHPPRLGLAPSSKQPAPALKPRQPFYSHNPFPLTYVPSSVTYLLCDPGLVDSFSEPVCIYTSSQAAVRSEGGSISARSAEPACVY